MTVEVTKLPHRPHCGDRQHAASADRHDGRVGRRPAAAMSSRRSTASRICWSTWPSRAPSARSARAIAEEIEQVGGDINAGHELRDHGLFRQRAEGRHAARHRCAVRHPVEAGLRSERAQARAERHRAGDRRHRRRAGRPGVRLSAVDRLSEPADGPRRFWARPRRCARSRTRTCGLTWTATTAAPTWWSRRPARSSTAPWSPRSSAASARSTARPRPCRSRRPSAAAPSSRRAISSRCTLRWRSKACRSATRTCSASQVFSIVRRRRHVVPAVPGGPREARPLLHHLGVPRALCRHRHVRHLCRHRRRRRARS